jgi:spore maturation protein CgeB
MRIVMFYHSAWSDWNHGNAHFLRGIATELVARGHDVEIFEPENAWSYRNLIVEHGRHPLRRFREIYPDLKLTRYRPKEIDLAEHLDNADLVLVHEWNDQDLVRRIGQHRALNSSYTLLFHDTHHRMITARKAMAGYDLSEYDGVLAYGEVLRELYERSGRVNRAWTWHEAADTRVFYPRANGTHHDGDLIWIGNWGDDERSAELQEFLIEPAKALSLKTRVHGVRYPELARNALLAANIEYAGWLPNFKAPEVFARFHVTMHVPRRPYTNALRGIPTIRVFEALACGIPLVCSPWDDAEHLFRPGRDYLVARTGKEMTRALRAVIHDRELAAQLALNGLKTILSRHTCAHRVDELLAIHTTLTQRAAALTT